MQYLGVRNDRIFYSFGAHPDAFGVTNVMELYWRFVFQAERGNGWKFDSWTLETERGPTSRGVATLLGLRNGVPKMHGSGK